MEITGNIGSAGNAPQNITVGDKLLASVIKSDGAGGYVLNMGGKTVEAQSPDLLSGKGLRLEVVATEPKLIVKLVPEKIDSAALLKLAMTPETQMKGDSPQPVKTSVLAFMAKEMASFEQKAVADVLKDFGAAKLAAFAPEEIRRALRDSGLFFEKKLIDGLSLKSDMKLSAMISGNEPAREALTKVQIANIFMDGGFFSFFEGDDLDFERGVMRFKRSEDGALSLYMKLEFTNLGVTVLSFSKNYEGGYNITVRTAKDISAQLSELDLEDCGVRWAKLSEKDAAFFDIDKDDMEMNAGLDIKA